ncbi:hypothetical protein BDB01DRAFT_783352 [Pilobolus umbonatus]|nr:hypothetical protein BDB01DRAFT_783352 [Pilobolus umbonatus]
MVNSNSIDLPSGDIIQAIRSSCSTYTEKSPIKISQEGIDRFLLTLDRAQFTELSEDALIRLPLRFSTVHEELNFIAVIDLLNFGSGFRIPLHELAGRGAFDTIRFGAMSFHIGGTPMDAKTFKDMSVHQVSEIFQFPIDREVRHETLDFVTLTEPTVLKSFAVAIQSVLNSTGDVLSSKGYKDLADFIMDQVKKEPQNARALLKQLVSTFPGLQDAYKLNGQVVYVYKKAQIMIYHLYITFKEQLPTLFDFKDIQELTVFADNVIPTLLIHLNIIEVPEAWKEDIASNTELSLETTTALRAASIVACDKVIAVNASRAGPHMTAGELDTYLWRVAKEGEYRKLPRIQYRDTVMF